MGTVTAILSLLACAGGEPAGRTTSVPLEATGEGLVEVVQPTVSRPDGRPAVRGSELAAADLPPLGLETLSPEAAQAALYALNTTVGPCEPCMDRGSSIARCLVDDREGCQNVPTVARRAARLAGQGIGALELLAHLRYDDPWYPDVEGRALGPQGGLMVVVAVDYDDPFSRQSAAVWDALDQRYGQRLSWAVLHRPDVERHPLGRRAALAALAAERQGRLAAVHAHLLGRASALDEDALAGLVDAVGLDRARFEADLADPGLAAQLAADLARAEALGVRGTPTVFVSGYRVRGARGEAAFAALIDDLLADAEDPWPAPG